MAWNREWLGPWTRELFDAATKSIPKLLGYETHRMCQNRKHPQWATWHTRFFLHLERSNYLLDTRVLQIVHCLNVCGSHYHFRLGMLVPKHCVCWEADIFLGVHLQKIEFSIFLKICLLLCLLSERSYDPEAVEFHLHQHAQILYALWSIAILTFVNLRFASIHSRILDRFNGERRPWRCVDSLKSRRCYGSWIPDTTHARSNPIGRMSFRLSNAEEYAIHTALRNTDARITCDLCTVWPSVLPSYALMWWDGWMGSTPRG